MSLSDETIYNVGLAVIDALGLEPLLDGVVYRTPHAAWARICDKVPTQYDLDEAEYNARIAVAESEQYQEDCRQTEDALRDLKTRLSGLQIAMRKAVEDLESDSRGTRDAAENKLFALVEELGDICDE